MVGFEPKPPIVFQLVVILPVDVTAQPVRYLDCVPANVQPLQITMGPVGGQTGEAKFCPGAGPFEPTQRFQVPVSEGTCLGI